MPVDVGDGYTVAGAYEKHDGVSRTVILRGEHHDIDPGDKLTIACPLRAIRHKEAVVNGVTVPGWTEIRVEQTRPSVAPVGRLEVGAQKANSPSLRCQG
jgi:hypothetical protein